MSIDLQVHVLIAVCCKVKHHDFGMASFDRTVRNKNNVKGCSFKNYFNYHNEDYILLKAPCSSKKQKQQQLCIL